MGDSYVQLPADGAGKKLQTQENVIGANTVHAEAVYQTTVLGAPIAPATDTELALIHAHIASIETDLALVHTHIGTIDTSIAAVEVHEGNIETDLALVHAHIATIDTAIGEINAHIHTLEAKTAGQTAYKYAYNNIQADGDLIALVAGKKIRIHALVIHAIDTSTGMIKTDDAGGAAMLEFNLSAREGMVLPFNPAGWFETVSGEALFVDFVVGAETMFVMVYSEV